VSTSSNLDLEYILLHDFRILKRLIEALEDVKVALRLGAISSVPFSVKNPEITREVNSNGRLQADVKQKVYSKVKTEK